MDIMRLSNVIVSEKVKGQFPFTAETKFAYRANLDTVIWELATARPMWTFVITSGGGYLADGRFFPTAFEVREGGERIGAILSEKYRNHQSIGISCRRISEKLEHSNTQYTKNIVTAVTRAKKMFTRMNVVERLEENENTAERIIKQAVWTANRKTDELYGKIAPYIQDFALVAQRDEFEAYLNSVDQVQQIGGALVDFEKQKVDRTIVTSVKDAWEGGRSTMVVVAPEGYLVRNRGGMTNVYSDDTIPENLRGKLGLLKLVQDGQMVSSVGCRITDEIFVLLNE